MVQSYISFIIGVELLCIGLVNLYSLGFADDRTITEKIRIAIDMHIKVVLILPINMPQNHGVLTPLYTDYVTRPFCTTTKTNGKKRSGNARLVCFMI